MDDKVIRPDNSFSRTLEGRDRYYNTKIKVYPDGRIITTYCSKPIYSYDEDRNGLITEIIYPAEDPEAAEDAPKETVDRSYQHMKRAKEKAFDIIFMNDWANWCTFTFNPKLVDSTNKQEVMKKLTIWLRNQHYRNGLEYFLIPEYHKRSKDRIHIHCLTNDALDLTDSGTVKVEGIKAPMRISTADKFGIPENKRYPIYNVDNWQYGFSTCEKIYGSIEKVASYLQKYMTKDVKRIFGKYYWSSRGICREPKIIYTDTDFGSVKAEEHYCAEAGISLKYESAFDYTMR